MKPEAQRIAITEACGWHHLDLDDGEPWGYAPGDEYPQNDQGVNGSWVPDYLNDLNAMHEAEKLVAGDITKCLIYQRFLASVVGSEDYPYKYQFVWHSRASERAEAFLRTLNLWTEE